MKGILVEKSRLGELVDDLVKRYKVYAPIDKEGLTCFDEIRSSSDLSPTFPSKTPAKEVLFPQSEILFRYHQIHGDVTLEEEQVGAEMTVLFGLPPCEARGLALIERAFTSGDVQDAYYLRRRENALIIGKSCEDPPSTCFCTSVGGSPFGREGSDLVLQDLGDDYLLEAVSEKGETLIETLQGYDEATEAHIVEARRLAKIADSSLTSCVEVTGIDERLEGMFDDPLWEAIYKKCVGCGVCTYLCPTCYCFDVVDEPKGSRGVRVRIWDSCQYPLFTLQGSGENPRSSGKERMRQRIMHKFNYYPKIFSMIACVGCGRCVRECPVNLDIREILRRIVVE
jgi:ferredoxin